VSLTLSDIWQNWPAIYRAWRLPAGMAYMLKNTSPSLTQTLLGFLDSRQQARGNAPVRLHCRRDRQGDAVDWSNLAVNQVFAGVAAMMQAGLLTRVVVDSYSFVVPEIGYLLAALAVYGSRPPQTVHALVQAYAAQNPAELSSAILMDFAHWYSQSGEAQHESTPYQLRLGPSRS
jgi:hypothetical protein